MPLSNTMIKMFFGSNKETKIAQQVFEYLETAEACIDKCQESFEQYLQRNLADEDFFKNNLKPVHKLESKCDDKRNEIEYTMYHKSLIPESRGDILGLLETTDKIPNKAESMLRELYISNLSLPESFKQEFKDFFSLNVQAAKLALSIVSHYFKAPDKILEINSQIDKLESQSDVAQMRLQRKIMISDLSDLQKILLKGFLAKIGNLSDVAEDLGLRIKLLSVKTVF